MKKIKSKVLNMNLKRNFIILLIIAIAFTIGSGLYIYLNLGDQLKSIETKVEQQYESKDQTGEITTTSTIKTTNDTGVSKLYIAAEKTNAEAKTTASSTDETVTETTTDNENNHEDGEHGNKDEFDIEHIDFENLITLSTTNEIVLTAIGTIAALIGLMYWLLCMAWIYRKSTKLGCRRGLWTLLTLFFNLAAMILLALRAYALGTCKSCGHIRGFKNKYCSNCGTPFKIRCKKCGEFIPTDSKYCAHCGNKIDNQIDE